MKAEEWKDITGFEGRYQVSNEGQVRRLAHIVSRSDNRPLPLKAMTLNPTPDKHGYLAMMLPGGRRHYVHRLVAQEFLDNPQSHPMVLHWDGNPLNNHVENLRWGTQSENMRDRERHGTDPYRNRTHCPSGHEYSKENTYDEGRKRKCRICRTEHARNYRERERLKRLTINPA